MASSLVTADQVVPEALSPDLRVCESFLKNGMLKELVAFLDAKFESVDSIMALLGGDAYSSEDAVGRLFEIIMFVLHYLDKVGPLITNKLLKDLLVPSLEDGELTKALVSLALLLIKTLSDSGADGPYVKMPLEIVDRIRFGKPLDVAQAEEKQNMSSDVVQDSDRKLEIVGESLSSLGMDSDDGADLPLSFNEAAAVSAGDELIFDLYWRLHKAGQNACLESFEEFLFLTFIHKGMYKEAGEIEKKLGLYEKYVTMGLQQCQGLEGEDKIQRKQMVAMSGLDFYQLFLATDNTELADRLLSVVVSLYDTGDLRHGLASAAMTARRPALAFEHIKTALKMEPRSVAILDTYITMLIAEGKLEEAKTSFDDLVALVKEDGSRSVSSDPEDKESKPAARIKRLARLLRDAKISKEGTAV